MDFIFFFDYLFIYFNQVSFDQPRETNIEVVYATWYIFVPSFGNTDTANCLLACGHANGVACGMDHFHRRKPPRSISMHMGQSNPYSSY